MALLESNKINPLTHGQGDEVHGAGVDVVREQVRAQEEAAHGPEGAHRVHDADVHGGVVALHVVVDVGRAEGEQGGAAAAEEELKGK